MGKIDLKPSYQRGLVWSGPQKRLLIDSILRGYDIPKLYFRKVNRKPVENEVVDGHQRLNAVCEFFDDQFTLAEDADPVDAMSVACKTFSQLHTDVQLKLQSETFDVVYLEQYTDDEIEDMFARFQNGSPLNAPEKRRVIPGQMRSVVEALSKTAVIRDLAEFKDYRFAFEDVAAKIVHLAIAGKIVDVRSESLKKTYTNNSKIKIGDSRVVQVKRAMSFVHASLKDKKVKLKRIMAYMLPILVQQLAQEYDLYQHPQEFGKWYLSFETARAANNSKKPDDPTRDHELDRFTDSLRNDSVQALTYIESVLRRSLFGQIVDLAPLDPKRDFSDDQRFFIYHRDKGICQGCKTAVEIGAFHADHIKQHSKGGRTTVENGRVLCIPCNTSRSHN